MDSIPTLQSSNHVGSVFENQPTSQHLRVSKIQTLISDAIMFDSEFDMSPLINVLPKRQDIDSAVNTDIWDFDQIVSQIDAEKTIEDQKIFAKKQEMMKENDEK